MDKIVTPGSVVNSKGINFSAGAAYVPGAAASDLGLGSQVLSRLSAVQSAPINGNTWSAELQGEKYDKTTDLVTIILGRMRDLRAKMRENAQLNQARMNLFDASQMSGKTFVPPQGGAGVLGQDCSVLDHEQMSVKTFVPPQEGAGVRVLDHEQQGQVGLVHDVSVSVQNQGQVDLLEQGQVDLLKVKVVSITKLQQAQMDLVNNRNGFMDGSGFEPGYGGRNRDVSDGNHGEQGGYVRNDRIREDLVIQESRVQYGLGDDKTTFTLNMGFTSNDKVGGQVQNDVSVSVQNQGQVVGVKNVVQKISQGCGLIKDYIIDNTTRSRYNTIHGAYIQVWWIPYENDGFNLKLSVVLSDPRVQGGGFKFHFGP